MIKSNYSFSEPDDSFQTWCGITDMDNPSEELMENFVYDWQNCTCKKCKQGYERSIEEFKKQQRDLNEALS